MRASAGNLRGRELSHLTALSAQLLRDLIVEETLDVPVLDDLSLGCGLVSEDGLHNVLERRNAEVDREGHSNWPP